MTPSEAAKSQAQVVPSDVAGEAKDQAAVSSQEPTDAPRPESSTAPAITSTGTAATKNASSTSNISTPAATKTAPATNSTVSTTTKPESSPAKSEPLATKPEDDQDTSDDKSGRTSVVNEVFIAVMGQTGAGKSSFINWVTGGKLVEGESLSSCTQEVQSASTIIDGRAVTLIDTPGFDDSTRFDGEILNLIATYLRHSFNRNELLSGVIYLHRITDNRIGHTGRRTMTVLQRMCGADNFQNIALVTTMWDKLVDQKEGERHEKELETKGEFWAQMISRKAKVSRHYGKKETALKIVKQIIPRSTVSLTMQAELSLKRANVAGTAAGMVIAEYLLEQKKVIQENHEFIKLPLSPEKMTERIDTDIGYMKVPVEDLLAQAREAQTEIKDGGVTVAGGVTENKGAAEASNEPPPARNFLQKLIDMIRWMDLK